MNQKGKKAINLYDYIANKNQGNNEQIKQQIKTPQLLFQSKVKTHKESKENSYGFDTLLHFNDSLNMSSIQSHQKINVSEHKEQSRYGIMMKQAQDQIQQMRIKRQKLQNNWRKNKKYERIGQKHSNKYDKRYDDQNSSVSQLDTSQVQIYTLDKSKKTFLNTHEYVQQKDEFVQDLKKRIMRDKLNTLFNKIKKIYYTKIINELIWYNRMLDFEQKRCINLKKNVFEQWLQISKGIKQRQILKDLIINKIKKRRQKLDQAEYIQKFIKSLK